MGRGSHECLVHFQWETCDKRQNAGGFAGGAEAERKQFSCTQNPAASRSAAHCPVAGAAKDFIFLWAAAAAASVSTNQRTDY